MDLQEFKYWLEDLRIRDRLNDNPMVMVGGLTIIIVICFSLVLCHYTGGSTTGASMTVDLVYFDEAAQAIRLVEHTYPAAPKSPLEGTDNVFMATVFACEEKPEGALKDGMTLDQLKAEGMIIGWLERMNPEVTEQDFMFGEGFQYRLADGTQWYTNMQPECEKILTGPYERCKTAQIVRP